MLLPNKVVSFNESAISHFSTILGALEYKDMTVISLYNVVKTEVQDVGDFLEILDCLYVLGKVEYIKEQEALHYVDRS